MSKQEELPLVSVLVPVYNHEKFIGVTIESVLSQTYKNWELLIVDDCSTDGSWEIIQKYAGKDSRIKAFRNNENKGLIPNWKFLIDNSKGEYLAFLEGDDFFYENNLKKKIEVFEKYSDLGMVYCNFNLINEEGDILIKDHYHKHRIKTFKNRSVDPREFLSSKINFLSTYSQIMIKKGTLDISGHPRSFDESAKVFLPSDWDFSFRIATRSNIFFINETILNYRKHEGNNAANTPLVSQQLSLILDDYERIFRNDPSILGAIKYRRGKGVYFNIIYYIENNLKKDAWRSFAVYCIDYPNNLFRDVALNIKLFLRLLLPKNMNAYIKDKYYEK